MDFLCLVLRLAWIHLAQQGPPVKLDLDIVGFQDHWYQWIMGGNLALPYPILGSRNFPQAPYLEFSYLPLIVQNPLLGIPLHLHLNWNPLLGFICFQWDGHACLRRWEVWAGFCLMRWSEKSLCLTWESSTNSATIFLPELNAMNLYLPWRFPLGPRQITPLCENFVFASQTCLTINSQRFILFLSKKFHIDWTRVFQLSNSTEDALGYLTVHLWYPLVTVLIFSHYPWKFSNGKWVVNI